MKTIKNMFKSLKLSSVTLPNLCFKNLHFDILRKKERGVSLVDTLIVMGFVGMAVILIMIYVDPLNIVKRNRDIARLEDVDAVSRAIHLALLEGEISLKDTFDCGTCNTLKGTVAVNGTGWVEYTPLDGKRGLSRYLEELPVDPINNKKFFYKFVSDGLQGYKIAVPLESVEHKVKMRLDSGIYPDLYEVGTDMSLEFK
ncbi:type II secretion system protein [Patescibacteria group bacterium]|nr:type II secretion system protein [Patescibacteria group bacterium]